MHFNIYIDDDLSERLMKATADSPKSRNALIREAIDLWLNTYEKTHWPENILQFTGLKDFPAFESHRDESTETTADDPCV